MLVGTDMATDPEGIEVLLKLQKLYSDRLTITRFASDSTRIFHPKVWVFSFRSEPGAAIVGSSNLTIGGLDGRSSVNGSLTFSRAQNESDG